MAARTDAGPVVVSPDAARLELTALAPSVTIKSHLWHNWTWIAIEHERAARLARVALRAGQDTMSAETQASMVAVVAAAFALDALHGEIAPLVERSAEKRTRGTQSGYMLETFRRATPAANKWPNDWDWLFGLRSNAVHFLSEHHEPVPHPELPIKVSQQNADFAVESATRAVDLLLRAFCGASA